MKKAYKHYNNKNNFTSDEGGDKFAHIQAVVAKPLQVIVYNNDFDRALKAFRSIVQKERVLSDFKDRQSYEKPSVKRRRKQNEVNRKYAELKREKDTNKKSFKKDFLNE